MSSSPTETATLVDVTMPQMGVSVAEGTLAEWRVHVGDVIAADATICEISTDKIDSEVPSPASGVVAEILVAPGTTVPCGTVLARIARGDLPPAPAPAPPPAVANGHAARGAGPPLSPVVRRMLAEHGLDPARSPGTGRGGRIRKADVLAVLRDGSPPAAPDPEPAPLHIESPYRPDPPPVPVAPGGDDRVERVPLSRMRKAIAEHMTRSLRTAAHCTTIVEADMSAVERVRARLGTTYLPVVARAVVDALREFPALNATLEDDVLHVHRDVHLGIAVALEDAGLVVPVVRDAHELSAEGLAARVRDLARRARAGDLTPDEVRGGTFTITNPGAFGAIAATPIINQPQVAILDLEAVVKRPVVVTGPDGDDVIAIRPMANLCLSWDHRALDGALAARFLTAVRRRVETAG